MGFVAIVFIVLAIVVELLDFNAPEIGAICGGILFLGYILSPILSPLIIIVGLVTEDMSLVFIGSGLLVCMILTYITDEDFKDLFNDIIGSKISKMICITKKTKKPITDEELMTDEEYLNNYYNDALKLYNRFKDDNRK